MWSWAAALSMWRPPNSWCVSLPYDVTLPRSICEGTFKNPCVSPLTHHAWPHYNTNCFKIFWNGWCVSLPIRRHSAALTAWRNSGNACVSLCTHPTMLHYNTCFPHFEMLFRQRMEILTLDSVLRFHPPPNLNVDPAWYNGSSWVTHQQKINIEIWGRGKDTSSVRWLALCWYLWYWV